MTNIYFNSLFIRYNNNTITSITKYFIVKMSQSEQKTEILYMRRFFFFLLIMLQFCKQIFNLFPFANSEFNNSNNKKSFQRWKLMYCTEYKLNINVTF